jgi:aspartate kinase
MMVMKFGGTSVESADALCRVVEIVRARLARKPVVVVSAMGKTTNRLLAIASAAAMGHRDQALAELDALEEYHGREVEPVVTSAHCVELKCVLDQHFRVLRELVEGLAALGELTPRTLDAIASYGERISSRVASLVLSSAGIASAHMDARQLIVTDRRHTQAVPQFAETYARLGAAVPPVAEKRVAVLGGFIGATADGVTTTLGRGGGDYTASIVGAGIGAEEIEIWTDVDGVLTCDPTLVPDARRVKTLSFAEAAELAYFGAKVLHPYTVLPAMEKNIPVRILNSRRPGVPGTQIVAQATPCANVLKSVACKRNITVVDIRSTRMLMAHGFLRRIFEAFDRYETPVDMLATSEVSVSLTIDNPARLEEICAELRPFAEVSVEDRQAILCAVGENLRYTPGVAARVFGALENVNVRMISQGASLLNLSCVVAEADLPRAVAALHREFFTELDAAVFA